MRLAENQTTSHPKVVDHLSAVARLLAHAGEEASILAVDATGQGNSRFVMEAGRVVSECPHTQGAGPSTERDGRPLIAGGRLWGYLLAGRQLLSDALAAACYAAAVDLAYRDRLQKQGDLEAQLTVLRSQLAERRAALDMAEEVSGTSGFRWNPGLRRDIWSRATYLLLGYDPDVDQATYENVLARLHPDDLQRWKRTVEPAAEAGEEWRIEYRILMPDGAIRVAESSGRPGPDGWYSGGAIDLTGRRRAEDNLRAAQLELSRVATATSLGELAAAIAHEVNQPLTAVGAHAAAGGRWLKRSPANLERTRESLRSIVAEARRAGEIIQGLHALARQSAPAFEPLCLDAIAREVMAALRPDFHRQSVNVQLDLRAGSRQILGARGQLKQVLLNLITNALDAMSGSVTRTLRVASWIEADRAVQLAVEDSGTGFDPAQTEQLFTAFYSTKPTGMGMGLAICRTILERHGGTLDAVPRHGGGSTFLFSLPVTTSVLLE